MAERMAIAKVAVEDLKFLNLKGKEGISQIYEFEVEMVSKDPNIDVRKMLGTNLTVEVETTTEGGSSEANEIANNPVVGTMKKMMKLAEEKAGEAAEVASIPRKVMELAIGSVGSPQKPRYFSGRVRRFEMEGPAHVHSEYYIYKATVVAPLWFLNQGKDYKIFQEKTVKDIVKEILDKFNVDHEFKLSGNYRDWGFVVQYNESCFNFISRLMEHEGMYYWFKHEDGGVKMIIADDLTASETFPQYENLNYVSGPSQVGDTRELISSWRHTAQVTPSKYTVIDFDFRKPKTSLDTNTDNKLDGDDDIEVYEWQGGYQELADGDCYAKLRLEEFKTPQEYIEADTNARGVCPGYKFKLANHPRNSENIECLVLNAKYEISVHDYASGSVSQDNFETSFECLPTSIQFRAPRKTPEPKTTGPQTATVVGPEDGKPYTEKHGRVKVHFHWDRDGKKDGEDSCWVRVSSPWASTGYGSLQIPRVGDEVIVDFIGGSPDRPIIVGRVYNEDNKNLVDMTSEAHKTGFRTRTIDGGSDNQNFMLFTDKKGEELLNIQAEKDMKQNIKHNVFINIG
ncbi:type VI secretion system Vgr family protein [Taylorella equigenitalis]|uniref:type VI secretion system Vgr family protein n=1 Tax=Taylorella equigenitalis TaxID=29575 RepID=UPI00237E0A77|nr:type VI secretion system tip protein TssI/VgrG [Taylorella equigenitalis]WDU51968.1 type VI secretion system tip protein VgrG [Taylorella equigenitalis]